MEAGRATTLAVALSARLLGTPLPAAVAAVLTHDRSSSWLIARAEWLLIDPNGDNDHDERAFATPPIHLMTFALTCSYRYAVLLPDPRSAPSPISALASFSGCEIRSR